MTSISAEQQEFRGKLVAFGLLLTNVNRVYNESITETMDSVMIESETLLTDGVMGSGASGVTAGEKIKIKALWSICRHEYELG